MFTATADLILPTTVTGSWPRPGWYSGGLWQRSLSDALTDVTYREQFTDALSVVVGDQERAGLDIVTNGDYHLDPDIGGQSWMLYPIERMRGVAGPRTSIIGGNIPYSLGSILAEVLGSWRMPAVTGDIEDGGPLEFAKLWRLTQARTQLPVKFGTVSTQFIANMITVNTGRYPENKRELMWDMAGVMNGELRRLADAGCKVIQIEEPLLHFIAATSPQSKDLDFLIECFNYEISGLEKAEVWVHTCWGNANMQRSVRTSSYANAIDMFLNRVGGDVWTVEMKDRRYADLDLFGSYRGSMPKKIALGVVSHRSLEVEGADEVAADIREALRHIELEKLILTSDCGFGRGGPNRLVAFHKASAIAQGANIVRRELGLPTTRIRAVDPALQIDIEGGRLEESDA